MVSSGFTPLARQALLSYCQNKSPPAGTDHIVYGSLRMVHEWRCGSKTLLFLRCRPSTCLTFIPLTPDQRKGSLLRPGPQMENTCTQQQRLKKRRRLSVGRTVGKDLSQRSTQQRA